MSIKYKFTLSIGIADASQEDIIGVDEIGYTDEEWEEIEKEEQEKILEIEWQYWMSGYIDGGFHRVDE